MRTVDDDDAAKAGTSTKAAAKAETAAKAGTKNKAAPGTEVRTRTPSRDIHAALVEAAEAVLVREGPEAVTVRAVASEAGVAPMGVYNRFGSKDGLIDVLLIRGFAGLRDAMQTPGVHDPLARIRQAGVQYREFALANRQHYAIMFEGAVPVAGHSAELGEVATAAFNGIAAHMEFAVAAGAIRAEDPHELAQQVWSAVHGAVALELHSHSQVPDPATNFGRLLDLLVRGLRVDHPGHDTE